VVTELGQRLVEQAKNILDQANIFKDMALLGKDELNSPLKLGAIYTIGPYLFPHLMPKIRSAAPDMPLYIEENYTAVLRKKLKQCELDAIIVALPFNEPDVVTLPLYDEPFVVLLPKDHALSKHQTISSDMLLTDNLLMLGPGHCFRDQVLAACPNILNSIGLSGLERESKQKLITEGSSLETIRHMVASGLGISILPQSAAMKGYYDESLLDVRPFEAPVPYRSVALAWRVTFPRPKAIDLLAMATKKCKVLTADD
jgi:LysR family hydrogen peroxide-inducible transcriptional activator